MERGGFSKNEYAALARGLDIPLEMGYRMDEFWVEGKEKRLRRET